MTPRVTIIVPCRNESGTIELLLKAILNQTFPIKQIKAVIADGISTDGTRDIIHAFAEKHPELAIELIENPERIIPAALNRAIEHSNGDVIVRLDAHSIPSTHYVETCVATLEETGAANAGGQWAIRPQTNKWMARAIAVAASHPLGAGDARYRVGGEAGPVDTVPFGAFRREWIERIGKFNRNLLTNEDYEYNFRIRQAGGLVWYDPAIKSVYIARGTLIALAKQYARYGFWKARMLIRHPGSVRWRQILPPSFVLTAILFGCMSIFIPTARLVFGAQMLIYVTFLLTAAVIEAGRRRDASLIMGFPLAIGTMHFSWGGAFLWGLVAALFGGWREAS
jgi:glycosyltransferase involved in cell wall biosynthesis